jgi:intracellular multiplication protein IcmD
MMNSIRKIKKSCFAKGLLLLLTAGACFYTGHAFAASSLSDIATNITGTFSDVGKLVVAIAYIAGFGFVMASIFKFKQHKDNPTQIPMGTPIAMLILGIALLFMPSIITTGSQTIFGGSATAGGFSGEGATSVSGQGS